MVLKTWNWIMAKYNPALCIIHFKILYYFDETLQKPAVVTAVVVAFD